MKKQIGTFIIIFITSLIISACTGYSISLNQNEVYTPPTLLTGYVTPDLTLESCVKNAIKEQQVTRFEELYSLVCPPGEIQDLSGIEVFTSLKNLGLSGNKLTKIGAFINLRKLSQLDLSNNNITDASDLNSITSLTRVDLSGNKGLKCESVKSFAQLILPDHCTNSY